MHAASCNLIPECLDPCKAESQVCCVCDPVNVTLFCRSRPRLGHCMKEDVRGGLSSIVCTHCEHGGVPHGAVAPLRRRVR